jgi:hypothetical protein
LTPWETNIRRKWLKRVSYIACESWNEFQKKLNAHETVIETAMFMVRKFPLLTGGDPL